MLGKWELEIKNVTTTQGCGKEISNLNRLTIKGNHNSNYLFNSLLYKKNQKVSGPQISISPK